MGWLLSAGSSAISDHVSGRSKNWWTGENSWWGKLTGGGSSKEEYNVSVVTQREKPKQFPYILLALAYFVFK